MLFWAFFALFRTGGHHSIEWRSCQRSGSGGEIEEMLHPVAPPTIPLVATK
jgi:hypothetical protein